MERVPADLNRVERRKKLEERIAGSGDEDLLARIAEKLEEKSVGLARARGQDDPLRRDLRSAPFEVGGHRLACRLDPERRRVVAPAGRFSKKSEKPFGAAESRACRGRLREVEHACPAARLSSSNRERRLGRRSHRVRFENMGWRAS